MGGVQTPAPIGYCHSSLPLLASKASKLPFISPANTRLLAVARAPPYIGRSVLYCQAMAPVVVSMAEKVPFGGKVLRSVAMLPPEYWPMIGVPGTYLSGSGFRVKICASFTPM